MNKISKKIMFFSLINLIFIDIVRAETYNNYSDTSVSCGSLGNIPSALPKVTSIIYNIIRIGVPILLVIFGMIDLVKGIMASKEDEMKKGQQIFIKRLVAGVLIFFVFTIVKFVISLASDDSPSLISCTECLILNDCVTDRNFSCNFDDVVFTFNYGNLISVRTNEGRDLHEGTSDFAPIKKSECPTNSDAYVEMETLADGSIKYHLKKK